MLTPNNLEIRLGMLAQFTHIAIGADQIAIVTHSVVITCAEDILDFTDKIILAIEDHCHGRIRFHVSFLFLKQNDLYPVIEV